MVHILRAVSVCELNEVFQELNIYLYLKLLKYVFHNLSNSSLIYPTSPVSAFHVMLKSFFFFAVVLVVMHTLDLTIREMGTSFRRDDFWNHLGGQPLLMMG